MRRQPEGDAPREKGTKLERLARGMRPWTCRKVHLEEASKLARPVPLLKDGDASSNADEDQRAGPKARKRRSKFRVPNVILVINASPPYKQLSEHQSTKSFFHISPVCPK